MFNNHECVSNFVEIYLIVTCNISVRVVLTNRPLEWLKLNLNEFVLSNKEKKLSAEEKKWEVQILSF